MTAKLSSSRSQRIQAATLLVSVCLLAPVLSQTASATPIILISESFESYETVPVSIHGLNPGDGNPNNWSAAGTQGGATNQVIAGSSTGGAGDNERVLRLHSGTAQSARFSRAFAAPVTLASGTPVVTVSFKVQVGGGSQDQLFRLYGEGFDDVITTLRLAASNQLRYLRTDNEPGSGTNVWVTVPTGTFTFSPEHWYELTMTADIETQQWGFTAVNLSNPAQYYELDGLWFRDDQQVISGFRSHNRSGSLGPVDAYVDDILITAIPEPGSLMLLLAALSGLLVSRRNCSSHPPNGEDKQGNTGTSHEYVS